MVLTGSIDYSKSERTWAAELSTRLMLNPFSRDLEEMGTASDNLRLVLPEIHEICGGLHCITESERLPPSSVEAILSSENALISEEQVGESSPRMK